MEVVLVAAGKGSRMGCVGKYNPKCMFRVKGKPLLHQQFEAFRSAGIKKVTIVTGHLQQKIPVDFPGLAIKSVHNPDYSITGGAYSFLLGSADIDDDLIYVVSDIWYQPELISRLSSCSGAITLAVQVRGTSADDMKVCLNNNQISKIGKTIPVAEAQGAFLGAAYIPRDKVREFQKFTAGILATPEKMKIHFGDIIQEMVCALTPINAVDMTDLVWCEIDNIQDLSRARRRLMEADISAIS